MPLTDDQIRADTLRWAADRLDPGPSATRPRAGDERHEHTMDAYRGAASQLRLMAGQVERGYIAATALPIEQRIAEG